MPIQRKLDSYLVFVLLCIKPNLIQHIHITSMFSKNLHGLRSWVLGVDNLAKWQKNMLQLKLFGGLFGHKSADS